MRRTVSRNLGSSFQDEYCHEASWSRAGVSNVAQPMISSANLWADTAALRRDSRAARVRMSGPRVSRQGSNRVMSIGGDLRTGAWASGHVVCAKSSIDWGRDIKKSLTMLLGFLHSSLYWAHSRFASGCGPNRRTCWIPLSMLSMSTWLNLYHTHLAPSHGSHAAHILLKRLAGSHKMAHTSLGRSAWCNQSGSGPQRNENFRV
jgi:hypothetical protein